MASPPFLPDEAKPADSDIVSQYPAVERTFRDIIESWLLIDHDTDGEHAQVTLPERGSDPTFASNTGFFYTKDDGGDTEGFYLDDTGNVVQITKDGALNVSSGVLDAPAGTSILFYQSAAPAGWTKDVAATLNNHALRIVTSTAWSGGSKGATAFDSVFGAGKTTSSYTIAVADLPATVAIGSVGPSSQGANVGSSFKVPRVENANSWGGGGGGGHTHTLSLDLNYINVIRATKD